MSECGSVSLRESLRSFVRRYSLRVRERSLSRDRDTNRNRDTDGEESGKDAVVVVSLAMLPDGSQSVLSESRRGNNPKPEEDC